MPADSEAQMAKRLRLAIGQVKALLTRTEKFVDEQKKQVLIDLGGLELRLEELERSLRSYRDLSLELLVLTEEEASAEDETEGRFYSIMVDIKNIIKKQSSGSKDPRTNTGAPPQGNKLPIIDIAPFDGKLITEYKPFMDLFTAVVDQDSNLTSVQKLFYLKRYLKDDALLLINSLPLINDSYKQALELLDKRYNNKCLVITHHVNALLDYQPITRGTSSDFRHFVSVVRQNLGALKGQGQSVEHWDMIIVPILLRKLDSLSCRLFYSERDTTKLPNVEELLSFVERRAMSFEESQMSSSKSPVNKSNYTKTVHIANSGDFKTKFCRYCNKSDHKIFACKEFQALGAQDRIDFATKENLCKICLNIHTKKCQFHFKCSICKSKEHNSLLHFEQQACNVCGSKELKNTMVLLPTVKVNFRTKDGSFVTARGLIDSGSQVSFINTKLIDKLNVQTFDYNIKITALGQSPRPVTRAVNLTMYSRHSDYSCNALFSVVDSITSFLPQTKCDLNGMEIPSSIKLADDEFNIPGEIQFLVSADIFFRMLLPEKIALSRDLFLLATQYGYIVSGDIKKNVCLLSSQNILNDSSVVMHSLLGTTEETLDFRVDSLLQKFLEEQHTPETKTEDTANPDVCELEFQKSVKLIENRFQVSLPLKVPISEVKLGDSFSKALLRLNVLCKKLQNREDLKERYVQFINEYLALGHARKIDLFKLEKPLDSCYVLPHHAVLREDSVTTKLRVVFDASAKTDLNQSLNTISRAGPVVQKELFDILVLFRTYKYVAIADIKQMYRQIRVDPAQAHLQLILWKENIDDPLSCFQLQTVTYGVASSSFLATRCLVELAKRFGHQYPRAASVILNNSYVDDFLFGAASLQELQCISSELIELTGRGSFELHKWAANHPNVLDSIDHSKKQFGEIDMNNADLSVKALGLQLNINSDNFILSKPCGRLFSEWTKRTVLSFIGSFFDPLGLAGPIVTKAKEFLQNVWRQNLKWDAPLPDELLLPWNYFFRDLMSMKSISISRSLLMSDAGTADLIGYCDASNIAYGACIYVRVVLHGHVKVTLVCSKSRIAPMKTKQTIPRLELNACLLLANLYQRVNSIFQGWNIQSRVLYSDSQIALCWIENPPPKDNYVKRRALAVQEKTKNYTWAHVSGVCNPADCLSRGLMPSELNSNSLWWQGSPELKELNFSPKKFCAKDVQVIKIPTNDRLENVQSVNCNQFEEVLPVSKFSSLLKLQRVVSYVLRFIKNCKLNKKDCNRSTQLDISEYRLSMQAVIKHVQSLHFSDDIKRIKNNQVVKSNIKKLYPFLDLDGIMRVGGRLDNANIPYSQKHPIILPKNCNFTNLVIRNEHCSLLHAGLKLTLSSLTQKYYIISATVLVKRMINKCVKCFKFRVRTAEQLMAALPQDRVVKDRPFNKVGIDYCGPFNIKQSTLRRTIVSKGYVCIFVCFVAKCIHMELVSDLTTEAFLAAFKRFISRRGLPRLVYCDNASTFKGANNQLKQLFELNKSPNHHNSVTDYCNEKGIEFKFIPSYSPTWGGLWEAAVKSAKFHFKRIIGNLLLTYEQFNTIIVQVEAILNSRPISSFSSDISDFTFLTPGHFLIGQALTAIPEPEVPSNNINVLRFWKKCTKIQQDFWRVWHKNYLSQMLSRPKWHRPKPNVKEGSLVLLLNENVSPLQWPLGRVIKVFKGSDGLVRSVQVKTKNGFCHTRVINKIAVLPIYDNN